MGLAVVYGIMKRHGGAIDAASVVGQGTSFTLTFLRALEPTPGAMPEAAPPMSVSPLRLLVVDDEEAVRQTLARLLRTAGHTVLEASDGPGALACLATVPVDLVCTDLGMPGMSGLELARQIESRHRGLPVILLTGWLEQPAGESGDPAGVEAILRKPIRLAELLRAVDAAATRRIARQDR